VAGAIIPMGLLIDEGYVKDYELDASGNKVPYYYQNGTKAGYRKTKTYVQDGLRVPAFLGIILSLLIFVILLDHWSGPPQFVYDNLGKFKAEMKRIQENQLPDGIDDKTDTAALKTLTSDAMATSRIRACGTKTLKFSGKRMATACQQVVSSKRPTMADTALDVAAAATGPTSQSIFGAFQKILDKEDPTNAFSTSSLATWKTSSKRLSLLQKASGGFGGMGSLKVKAKVSPGFAEDGGAAENV
jgi:hypothetical protein